MTNLLNKIDIILFSSARKMSKPIINNDLGILVYFATRYKISNESKYKNKCTVLLKKFITVFNDYNFSSGSLDGFESVFWAISYLKKSNIINNSYEYLEQIEDSLFKSIQNDSDDLIYEEINIAANNTLNFGFHGNQSVCHGDFGNLEILKALSKGSELDNNETERFINEVLTSISNDFLKGKKFYFGDASGDELIGLFLGLSGIGYQLLRFYEWETVPSILCLETPKSMNNVLH